MPDYLSSEVYIIVADDVPGEPGSIVGMAMQFDGSLTMMPAVTSDMAVLTKMIEVMVQTDRKFRVLRFGDRQDVTSQLTGRSGNGA